MPTPEEINENKRHLLELFEQRSEQLEDMGDDKVFVVSETKDLESVEAQSNFKAVEKWRGTAGEARKILEVVKYKIESGKELTEEEDTILRGSNVW